MNNKEMADFLLKLRNRQEMPIDEDEYYLIGDIADYLMVDVDAEPTMDKWISIDEKLPDKEGYYVIFRQYCVRDANRNREFTVTTSDVTWYSELSGFGDDTVTHWLPLPEPPEVK